MIKTFALVFTLVVALACGASDPAPPTPPTPPTPATPGTPATSPTPPTPPTPPTSPTSPTPPPADPHAHAAPHGGTLVELGEHFGFLEVVLDADAGSLTVYVLDGEAEQAVRIPQTALAVTFDAPKTLGGQALTLAAKANVLTGETVGDTSEFVVTHPALKGQTTFSARVVEVVVKGQSFKDLAIK